MLLPPGAFGRTCWLLIPFMVLSPFVASSPVLAAPPPQKPFLDLTVADADADADDDDEDDGGPFEVPPPPADNLAIPADLADKDRERLKEAIAELDSFLSSRGGNEINTIIRNLRRAEKRSKAPVARYHLGRAYRWDEDFARARKVLLGAVEASPDFYEALVELGNVAVAEFEVEEGIRHYDAALAIYPYYSAGLTQKAQALVQLGRLEEAEAVFATLQKMEPDSELWSAYREYLGKAIRGPSWPTTYIAETDYYQVRTGVSQQFADDVAACAEQVRKLYGKYFFEIDRVARKYEIIVYRSKAEYHANGGPPSAGGHYSPYLRTLNLYKYPKFADTLLVLNHEGFHQYLHEYLPNIPQWFNEGLGDFFGGAVIAPSGRKAAIDGNPWRVDFVIKALQYDAVPAASDLMNMTREEMYGRNAGVHYAQAWAMVYYSIMGGQKKYQNTLKNYFTGLRKGLSQSEAYRRTWATLDMNRFDQDWRSFIGSKLDSSKEIQKRREQVAGDR